MEILFFVINLVILLLYIGFIMLIRRTKKQEEKLGLEYYKAS
jgi:preprotein translocase subunit YajC